MQPKIGGTWTGTDLSIWASEQDQSELFCFGFFVLLHFRRLRKNLTFYATRINRFCCFFDSTKFWFSAQKLKKYKSPFFVCFCVKRRMKEMFCAQVWWLVERGQFQNLMSWYVVFKKLILIVRPYVCALFHCSTYVPLGNSVIRRKLSCVKQDNTVPRLA